EIPDCDWSSDVCSSDLCPRRYRRHPHTFIPPSANPQVGRGRAPAGTDDTHTHSYPPAPTPK
ncbi:hypothetical protein, partial [uncultured Duncaniella sp.]|uniref:hypothetical protein n=1 Tax=uncultured Duncaniella sp. TaxID=2768039 RepID=UPI0026F40448